MAWSLRVAAGVRPLGRALTASLVAVTVAIACTGTPTTPPPPPPTSAASAAVPAQAAATPAPRLIPPRAVGVIGESIAASGDFKGNGKSQIALLQDPTRDMSLRITLREPTGEGTSFNDAVWLTAAPRTLALYRARFAVADVNGDGKDDLVALYDSGEHRTTLFVMLSTGAAFNPPQAWWKGDEYVWTRARNLLSGKFSGGDRDSLLVTYQYDDFQVKVHSFDSNGSAFTYGGNQGVYDSGPGQLDLSLARFAVGHFTRTGGADQIAMFYQYPNARVRLHVFDPSPKGLVMQQNVYDTGEGQYDLGQASLAAADVTGDGKDDLVAIYGAADGTARVHVFDSASSFQPAKGFAGWATLPAGAACAGATAVLLGDWNSNRKLGIVAVAPGDGTQVRTSMLRNTGAAAFTVASGNEPTLCPRWPLTGMPLAGGPVTRRPLYVKIDNNPHARPHFGISRADQVYEWLVEGLTTRLAAVFHSQAPDAIGSVRSARITDTPIVPSLQAAFVYSGGGPEELMRLHYEDAVAHRYVDVGPSYGWGNRVDFREQPYNFFTTYAAVRNAVAAAPDGAQPVSVPSWDFLPVGAADLAGGLASSVPAATVTIPYRAGFEVTYKYDPATKGYARFDDGVREVDGANNEAIVASNIVVILTEVHQTTEFGLDPAGSPKLDMQLTGTGKGIVFRDGKRQEVTWTRPDVFDVFLLSNAAGEPVRLRPGQTWIQIVPSDWTIPSQ